MLTQEVPGYARLVPLNFRPQAKSTFPKTCLYVQDVPLYASAELVLAAVDPFHVFNQVRRVPEISYTVKALIDATFVPR